MFQHRRSLLRLAAFALLAQAAIACQSLTPIEKAMRERFDKRIAEKPAKKDSLENRYKAALVEMREADRLENIQYNEQSDATADFTKAVEKVWANSARMDQAALDAEFKPFRDKWVKLSGHETGSASSTGMPFEETNNWSAIDLKAVVNPMRKVTAVVKTSGDNFSRSRFSDDNDKNYIALFDRVEVRNTDVNAANLAGMGSDGSFMGMTIKKPLEGTVYVLHFGRSRSGLDQMMDRK